MEPALHGESLALGPAFRHGMSHNTIKLQSEGWSAGAYAGLFTHKSVSLPIWETAGGSEGAGAGLQFMVLSPHGPGEAHADYKGRTVQLLLELPVNHLSGYTFLCVAQTMCYI